MIRSSAAVSGLSAQSVYLALMPATHSFVFGHPGILGTLAAGGTVVFATSDDPQHVFSLVEEEGVTHVALVPALAAQWLSLVQASGGSPVDTRAVDGLSSLRVLQVGGARLDAGTAEGIQQELGCRVQQVYGMSEGLLHFTRLDDADEVITQTQGRPASPGDEVLVVDEDGKQVAPGAVGELITRGPSVIAGYYGDSEANRRAFTNAGYYRTGDLVRLHPSGNYVVAGRTKDVINRGGEKIAADELEELVRQHPQVHGAAAVAMPHRLYGEAVCLYVVPAGAGGPKLHEIRNFLEGRGLARFKLPARVELVDALPMVGVGKVDKVLLRKQIADRVAAERTARAWLAFASVYSAVPRGTYLTIISNWRPRWAALASLNRVGTWFPASAATYGGRRVRRGWRCRDREVLPGRVHMRLGEWPAARVCEWMPSTARVLSKPRSRFRRRPQPRSARRVRGARACLVARDTSRSTGSLRRSLGCAVLAMHSVDPCRAGFVEVLLCEQVSRCNPPNENASNLLAAGADWCDSGTDEVQVLARSGAQARDLRRRHDHGAVVADDHIQMLRHGGCHT